MGILFFIDGCFIDAHSIRNTTKAQIKASWHFDYHAMLRSLI